MEVFNPPLNFQNRMLQSDYIKIFEEVGFKYELTYKKSTHNIKIDKCFANYSKKRFRNYSYTFSLIQINILYEFFSSKKLCRYINNSKSEF